MSTQYKITRDKFFDIKQRNCILKSCDEYAELDRLSLSQVFHGYQGEKKKETS